MFIEQEFLNWLDDDYKIYKWYQEEVLYGNWEANPNHKVDRKRLFLVQSMTIFGIDSLREL